MSGGHCLSITQEHQLDQVNSLRRENIWIGCLVRIGTEVRKPIRIYSDLHSFWCSRQLEIERDLWDRCSKYSLDYINYNNSYQHDWCENKIDKQRNDHAKVCVWSCLVRSNKKTRWLRRSTKSSIITACISVEATMPSAMGMVSTSSYLGYEFSYSYDKLASASVCFETSLL